MPRWLQIFLFIFVLLLAVAIALLRTPRPLEYALTQVLKSKLPNATVKTVSISAYRLEDRQAILDHVSVNVVLDGVDYLVRSDEVIVGSWRALIGNFSNDFTVKGVHLASKDIEFSNASMQIRFKPIAKEDWLAQGSIRVPLASYLKQGITEIALDFSARPKSLSIKDLRANTLNGRINGEFMLEYRTDLPYSMDIIFAGIDTTALPAQLNISQQLKGVVDGSLKISGNTAAVAYLDVKINAPKGAYVNPYLLKLLTDYIPQSTQKKQMEEIIKSGRQVFMDRFVLDIINDKDRSLKTAFDLKSVEFNLDVDLKVDINVDGGLNNLFLNFINRYH